MTTAVGTIATASAGRRRALYSCMFVTFSTLYGTALKMVSLDREELNVRGKLQIRAFIFAASPARYPLSLTVDDLCQPAGFTANNDYQRRYDLFPRSPLGVV